MCNCRSKSKWHHENSRIFNETLKILNLIDSRNANDFVCGVKDYMMHYHRVSIFQYRAIRETYRNLKFHQECDYCSDDFVGLYDGYK